MAAAEQPKYEPGHVIARFCCGEPMKLIKVIPRIGSYPEIQTLSLPAMPQHRNC
jgi:hypothetical protein